MSTHLFLLLIVKHFVLTFTSVYFIELLSLFSFNHVFLGLITLIKILIYDSKRCNLVLKYYELGKYELYSLYRFTNISSYTKR